MILDNALAALRAASEPDRADRMLGHHKVPRVYLGVPNPAMNILTTEWRQSLDVPNRITLARDLWDTDIFEARIAAAKLLTQARLRPDDAAWALIQDWVATFDSWAIADAACSAGQRRLLADPARLDIVEGWTTSDHLWTRRAALVITLPWTKQNHPSAADAAIRDRVLGWAATYAEDPEWFIQKAIAWWVRDLSRHDAPRARAFLDTHGARLKPFARKELVRHLAD